MKSRERALKVFEEVAELNFPVAFERVPSNGKKTPAEYILCVRAKNFGLEEISRVTKLARNNELSVSIMVYGKSPVLVLA